jgi:hypothetical protein
MLGRHKHTIIEGTEPSTGLRYASFVYMRYDTAVGYGTLFNPLQIIHSYLSVSLSSCRFCRTYFLETGRTLPTLDLQEDLYEQKEVGETEAVDADDDLKSSIETREDAIVLERMKRLYVKLWLSLRATVRVAFQTFTDVLEAGTFIQNTIDSHMKGRSTLSNRNSEGISAGVILGLDSADPYLRDLSMTETERLQVVDFDDEFLEDRDRD